MHPCHRGKTGAGLGGAGRRDREGLVVSPVGAGRAVPPLSCDRPVGAHPEDVEVIVHPCHRGKTGAGLGGAGRRDREGLVVSPVGAGRAVPPLGCDRPVRAHPEDVEVVGRPGHGNYGRTCPSGAGRRDREGLVVSPVGAGRAVPPLGSTAPSGPTQKTSR